MNAANVYVHNCYRGTLRRGLGVEGMAEVKVLRLLTN